MVGSMMRTLFLIVALFFAAPVQAEGHTLHDRVVQVLVDDGYLEIRISRTWLGRTRFVGTNEVSRREIIINPNTSVVLRDYVRFFDLEDDDYDDRKTTTNGVTYDDDHDDEDDDEEDDDDEDEDDEDD